MKKKEPRWYIVWFFISGLWLITFCMNISANHKIDWVSILQFVNIFLAFAAGIINGRRYKKKLHEDEKDK